MIQNYLEKIRRQYNVNCLKAVIYARYSSENQRGESIDAQIRLITEFAQNNNIEIVGNYIDEAKSAKRDNRMEFQHMMSDAKKQKEWQLVLVHKLDRFARNRFDSAAYRVELRKNKKFLISTTEQFDDSPESSMMEAIIEAMAEFYSKNLAREVMKGLTENALKGKHCGGIPPLGYDIQNSRYVINEFEAQAVKLIFSLFLEGASYKHIIQELNKGGFKTKKNALFTKNSLYEILRNEKYIGTFVYNKAISRDAFSGKKSRHKYKSDDEIIRVENAFEAIILKEDFEKVQEILNTRKRASLNNAKETYLLTGKIKCAECGGNFVGTRNFNSRGVKYIFYKCNINQRSIHQRCHSRCVARDMLEENVINAISDNIMKFDNKMIDSIYEEYYNCIYDNNSEEEFALKSKISSINRELNRIADVITITNSPTFIERLTELEKQKANILARIDDLSEVNKTELSNAEIIILIDKAKKMLRERCVPYLKELIDLVVKEIIVSDDRIDVYLNFANNKKSE